MSNWEWLEKEVILAILAEQLDEHGGITGVRDTALLESALARPRQIEAYGDADPSRLAAGYVYGIARNHPFLDGNKRTALVAGELLLALNGYVLDAEDADCVVTMLQVAEGSLTEDEFRAWLQARIRKEA
ncbi:type II toxin-antitoxin system death-on-curing family toxin [Minwuia thermotolerans]|uniref:Type II toxin-antitoxin system death-on-curing family toxin n=1 Tax=Minwuia thermotolerans TaxID=2056226 RepID=A0A2M9G352_9PROT|nr:type II toxin-antitoxin system death-on-curing family toxin [Minwuia thermotolerans]PJK30124.1 type II toxin-antitoxin system death-on-curing family toxin [Minwuia thermotolerans]